MTSSNIQDQTILGVVGTGTMGRGIVQIAAAKGIKVLLFDIREEAVSEALVDIKGKFDMLVEKGRMSSAEADIAKDALVAINDLDKFSECTIIVEAIVEKTEAKISLFKQLDDIVSDNCILATNTSSLSVTEIQAGTKLPGRVAGFHFFNPVPVMKIVEVIGGIRTEQSVINTLQKLGEFCGHYAPVVKDAPGFIVNHAGRAFGTEALRILGEGIAKPVDIDRTLGDLAHFKIGPFALLDLIGIDVTHAVMESIYDQFFQEPRYRPSYITKQYVMAELKGRKTKQGFYKYEGNRPLWEDEVAVITGEKTAIWLGAVTIAKSQIETILNEAGWPVDEADLPSENSIILLTPIGKDVTTTAVDNNYPAERCIGIDSIFNFETRVCLMSSPVTTDAVKQSIQYAFSSAGKKVTMINDSPGFIAQRIIAHIVNIGADIAQQRIASPTDVNRAVKMGLGYPFGSLEFGDHIGPKVILTILENLYEFYGDPRYRPSPWLKRRALLGVSLNTEE